MSYFLVGNGNPKEGILFKFEQFMGEHGELIQNIKDIKTKVDELHGRADENKEAAATAMRAIEKYRLEENLFKAGKDDVIKANKLRQNLLISRVSTIIAIGISLFMAWLGYRSLMLQGKATETESKITNELLAPDSTQTSVSIRGDVYIPFLKTDSANIILSNKVDSMYEKYLRGQK